jgi:hypothetical protein
LEAADIPGSKFHVSVAQFVKLCELSLEKKTTILKLLIDFDGKCDL